MCRIDISTVFRLNIIIHFDSNDEPFGQFDPLANLVCPIPTKKIYKQDFVNWKIKKLSF